LSAINRAQVTVFIGPGIPDVHIVVPEVLDVRITRQKPQKLMNNAFEENLPGCDQRKSLGQIEPQLGAENAFGAGAGSIAARHAVFENVP